MRFSGSSVLKIGGNFKKLAIKPCMIPDTAKNTEWPLGSVLWGVPAAGPDPHQRVGTNAGSSSAPSPKTAPMWMRCSRKQGCPSTGRWVGWSKKGSVSAIRDHPATPMQIRFCRQRMTASWRKPPRSCSPATTGCCASCWTSALTAAQPVITCLLIAWG